MQTATQSFLDARNFLLKHCDDYLVLLDSKGNLVKEGEVSLKLGDARPTTLMTAIITSSLENFRE